MAKHIFTTVVEGLTINIILHQQNMKIHAHTHVQKWTLFFFTRASWGTQRMMMMISAATRADNFESAITNSSKKSFCQRETCNRLAFTSSFMQPEQTLSHILFAIQTSNVLHNTLTNSHHPRCGSSHLNNKETPPCRYTLITRIYSNNASFEPAPTHHKYPQSTAHTVLLFI